MQSTAHTLQPLSGREQASTCWAEELEQPSNASGKLEAEQAASCRLEGVARPCPAADAGIAWPRDPFAPSQPLRPEDVGPF